MQNNGLVLRSRIAFKRYKRLNCAPAVGRPTEFAWLIEKQCSANAIGKHIPLSIV